MGSLRPTVLESLSFSVIYFSIRVSVLDYELKIDSRESDELGNTRESR